MTSVRFVGDLPLWLGLLLSLVVCALSWRYYSRESFDLPRRLKWFLPLLRSLAFFLGIMVLTGPVLHHRTIIGELGRVKIYLDASRSMTMQDRHMSVGRKLMIAEQLGWISAGHVDANDDSIMEVINSGDESIRSALAMFDETPRWRRAELGLSESSAHILATLRETHDVEVLTLTGEEAMSNVGWASSPSSPSSQNADKQSTPNIEDFSNVTDLSSGIIATQKSTTASDESTATAKPKTAIVLLTDGQHNTGPSPLQTARVLGSQGVAFYNVSVGASQQASDLAVIGLEHPDLVFQKDKVRGVMIIRDQMLPGKPFAAQISYEGEVLWQQQLVTQNVPERRIEFEFAIDELVTKLGTQFVSDIKQNAVPLAFEASIAPLPEESETDNNSRTMRLAAIVSSYKLLIIDGRSRWETRYIRNVFERDEQWSVNTVIAGPGTDDVALRRGDLDGQFPENRDALFNYDIVIFGEVSLDLFTPQDLEWLSEFVEIRGGGIVFIDGQRRSLQRLADTNLGSLLPVEWQPDNIASKPASMQLTDKGASESALNLAVDEQQNRRFWTELPPPHSLIAVEALPGAETLVEINVDGRQRPLMVTRAFGAGRVLYLASDETWRWRYKVADIWHQRIWNQLAKYVMPRPFAVSDEFVSLDTGSVRYDFGATVDVRARLLGLDGKPAINATADALVWKDGRIVSTVSLNADTDVPGIYRGRIAALPEGEYEVSLRAAGYSDAALKARSQFVVLPPESGEMTQTAANESLLKQMAVDTGGAFLREEEMSSLLELLSPLSSGRVVESETLIWQSYWWFAAIVLLLTIEWVLRKRAGLL